ncbi:MAG TPA: PAS domain S-box protein, partial [Gaiellales bacterium]
MWWALAAGAAAAAAWWLLAGSGTAWYWRAGPAIVWLAIIAGAVSGAVVSSRRRRRHVALAQAIVASAPDAVIVVDARGTVVECNRAAETMLGLRRAAVVGAPLPGATFAVSGDGPLWERDGRHEATVSRAGGEFPVEVSVAPLIGVEARLQVMYVRDTSERRQAERAVHDLAAIIESSEDAIVSQTPDGIIESWNPGAEQLYGYAAAEAVGRRISLVEPRGRPDDSGAVLALVRRGEPIEGLETLRVRKDGSE